MSRELLKRAFPELMHFQFANGSAIERHNKLIAEIKAELSKPEPEPEPEPVCFAKWETIETAPKDGTEVLLFALFDIGLCYWSDKMDYWTWGLESYSTIRLTGCHFQKFQVNATTYMLSLSR